MGLLGDQSSRVSRARGGHIYIDALTDPSHPPRPTTHRRAHQGIKCTAAATGKPDRKCHCIHVPLSPQTPARRLCMHAFSLARLRDAHT